VNEPITEPAQQAVTDPAEALSEIGGQVTNPALRLAVDEPGQSAKIKIPQVRVRQPTPVTKADIGRWLREAISAWQDASEDAVDRATEIIGAAKNPNMYSTLESLLSVGGALLGPIRPWAGAVSSALAIVLKDVVDAAPPSLDIETFRYSIIEAAKQVHDRFLEDLEKTEATLFRAARDLSLSVDAAHENTLLNVLKATAVSKSTSGIVGTDRATLRAELELGMLLHFAASGAMYSAPAGGSYPFVVVTDTYEITSARDESGDVMTPDRWDYARYKPLITTYFLPQFKPRLRTLMRLIGEPLDLSHLPVPLKLEFQSDVIGRARFNTHTALWQPPQAFEIDLVRTVSEGNMIPPGGLKKMIQVFDKPSVTPSLAKLIDSYAVSTPRYQGLGKVFSSFEVIGMILAREAWRGPFPPIDRFP
jgi:hypothetical protein